MPQTTQSPVILKYIWNVLFAIFYPALVVFSLVFTGVLLVFSNLSKIIFGIIRMFSKKPAPGKLTNHRKSSMHVGH